MRLALKILIGLVIVIGLSAGGGWLWLRGSLPNHAGEFKVQGLGEAVRIVRDRNGIPHIQAKSRNDAFFTLGFVHAQDRLWQLEMNRRIGAGRLAEMLGEAALPTDRFLRTLGVHALAERTFPRLTQDAQAAFNAYAAGINAHIASRKGALPPEFLILGVKPEPWKPADSIVWMKMMAWDLGGNWQAELQRARLAKRLSPERIAELLPPYPGEAPVPLPNLKALYEAAPLERAYAALPPVEEANGSNNWALAGGRSATGKPLLANDPHLGLAAPAIWYLAHVSAPGMEFIGATLPGIPSVVLGRTKRLAIAFTNTGPDVQDLYVEKVDLADPSRYLTPDGSRPFETRREVIKVKGRPDEVITVRTTRHGPVISDINANVKEIAGEGHVIAFAWTALAEDDLTAQSGIKMMAAETTPQFIEALRDFHAPQQNVVFADIDGNIGFYAPGRVPVRKPEHRTKGLMPAPGWEAENDWDGYIPFEELPQAFNPADGVVMTANHKVVPDDYKHHITHEWTVPFRARRITQLLDERPSHSIDSFRAIQIDSISLFARDLLPLLLAVPVSDAKGGALQALLRRWDGKMDRNRPEGLVFHAWARELARALYEDDLGPLFEEYFETRPIFLLNALTTQQHWCDDIRTPAVETCADMIRLALDRAGGELRKAHGDDPARWRWGDAHPARSEHRPLGKVKSLRRFFDIRVPADGDTFTVNAARFNPRDPEGPFTMIHGASFRAIYDLDDLDRSIFIQSSGQSGNPLSKRFADFALPWSNGEYLSMSVRPVDYEAGAIGVLQLVPR